MTGEYRIKLQTHTTPFALTTPKRTLQPRVKKLSESKITLNFDKCEFAKSEIKFHGEATDQNGVRCDPQKFKAITEIPQPSD